MTNCKPVSIPSDHHVRLCKAGAYKVNKFRFDNNGYASAAVVSHSASSSCNGQPTLASHLHLSDDLPDVNILGHANMTRCCTEQQYCKPMNEPPCTLHGGSSVLGCRFAYLLNLGLLPFCVTCNQISFFFFA